MDREIRGEQRQEEEDAHDIGEHLASIAGEHVEHQLARLLVGAGRNFVGLHRADRDPGGEEVEDGDRDHGGVGRDRNRALWVGRLFAVKRGGLEAEKARERHHEAHAEPRREDKVGRQRMRRQRGGDTLGGDDAAIEDREDDHLAGHQDAQDDRREIDRAVAQHGDERDAERGVERPGQVQAGLSEHEIGEVAEEGGEPEGEGEVGGERHIGRADARCRPEALGDVGVEGAGVDDASAHRRVADGKAEQGDSGDDEGAGRARAVAAAERDGQVADH